MEEHDYISANNARFVKEVCTKMCGLRYKDDNNYQQDENSDQDDTNETENNDIEEEISNGQQTDDPFYISWNNLCKEIYEWLAIQGEHDDFETPAKKGHSDITIRRGQILISGAELERRFETSLANAYNVLKELAASGYIDRDTSTAKKTIITILDSNRAYDGLNDK